jgi:hypothetical protein
MVFWLLAGRWAVTMQSMHLSLRPNNKAWRTAPLRSKTINSVHSQNMRNGIFGQQMVMHVEAFGMTTTEQAIKYSNNKEEWWVSIRVGWFDSLLEDAMERISTRAPAARKCNDAGLQGETPRTPLTSLAARQIT